MRWAASQVISSGVIVLAATISLVSQACQQAGVGLPARFALSRSMSYTRVNDGDLAEVGSGRGDAVMLCSRSPLFAPESAT